MNFSVSVEWKTCMRYIQRIISDIYTTVVCSITANYYIFCYWLAKHISDIIIILHSIYIYGVRYCTNVYWYYVTVWDLKVTVRYYFNTTCYHIRCGAMWRMILCYCWWTLLSLFSYVTIITLTFSTSSRRTRGSCSTTPMKRCPAES